MIEKKGEKRGAKGKFEFWVTSDGLKTIEDWARQGLVDEQIYKNIGISHTTFYEWLKKYPEINEALKRGKVNVDFEVENALLKRALGYKTFEKRVKKEYGEITEEICIEKEVPPDATSAIFWLKNRRPECWREKREVTNNLISNNEPDALSKAISKLVGENDSV